MGMCGTYVAPPKVEKIEYTVTKRDGSVDRYSDDRPGESKAANILEGAEAASWGANYYRYSDVSKIEIDISHEPQEHADVTRLRKAFGHAVDEAEAYTEVLWSEVPDHERQGLDGKYFCVREVGRKNRYLCLRYHTWQEGRYVVRALKTPAYCEVVHKRYDCKSLDDLNCVIRAEKLS